LNQNQQNRHQSFTFNNSKFSPRDSIKNAPYTLNIHENESQISGAQVLDSYTIEPTQSIKASNTNALPKKDSIVRNNVSPRDMVRSIFRRPSPKPTVSTT
jgi:hypothetical protein